MTAGQQQLLRTVEGSLSFVMQQRLLLENSQQQNWCWDLTVALIAGPLLLSGGACRCSPVRHAWGTVGCPAADDVAWGALAAECQPV
jgi:hypothetical protein